MNEEQFEKIERYVHEKMSRQERLQFEAELQTDAELAANMEAYRMIEGEMEEYDQEAALKTSLQNIGARFVSEDTTSVKQSAHASVPVISAHAQFYKSNRWKRWAIAAAIIAVVVSGGIWYFFIKEENTNTATIAATHKGRDNAPVIPETDTATIVQPAAPTTIAKENSNQTISPANTKKKVPVSLSPAVLFIRHFTPDATPEDKSGPLEDAFANYENKNYSDAIGAINDADLDFVTRGQQTPPELTKWYARYYKGICYLAMDSAVKSIPELEDAATNAPDSLLQVKAQWYLALGYLKANKVQQARDVLQQIAANQSDKTYPTKAALLLRKLKSLKQ